MISYINVTSVYIFIYSKLIVWEILLKCISAAFIPNYFFTHFQVSNNLCA